jgi:hypothetical protein
MTTNISKDLILLLWVTVVSCAGILFTMLATFFRAANGDLGWAMFNLILCVINSFVFSYFLLETLKEYKKCSNDSNE